MSTIFRRTSRSWMHGTSRTRLPMSLWSPSSILAKYFSGMKWVYASMRMEALRLVHGKDGGHGICPQRSPRRKADGNTSIRTNNVDQRLAAVVGHRIARAGERAGKFFRPLHGLGVAADRTAQILGRDRLARLRFALGSRAAWGAGTRTMGAKSYWTEREVTTRAAAGARAKEEVRRATDKRPLTASRWDAINAANNINGPKNG